MNRKIAFHLMSTFNELYAANPSAEIQLWDIAESTFWPVNQCLFGESVVSKKSSPNFLSDYTQYNDSFEQVANGIPRVSPTPYFISSSYTILTIALGFFPRNGICSTTYFFSLWKSH